MMSQQSAADRFRELLSEKTYVLAPGIYTAVQARLAELTDHDAVSISGGATNVGIHGLADGVIGMSEMVDNTRRVCESTNLPVISDVDTGFGGENHIARTVASSAKAGAAGIIIEDQVFPKQCGKEAGKEIVPRNEAKSRIQTAIDARNELDKDLLIIARTDADGAENGGWNECIERGRMFADMGVDMVFPEMYAPSPKDVIEYAESVSETHPNTDLKFNYASLQKWSQEEDPLTLDELGQLGYNFITMPLFALNLGAKHIYDGFENLKKNGIDAQFQVEREWEGHEVFGDVTNVFSMLGEDTDLEQNS
jgi:isocitrate lyase